MDADSLYKLLLVEVRKSNKTDLGHVLLDVATALAPKLSLKRVRKPAKQKRVIRASPELDKILNTLLNEKP
jgi:hypothetical protein